MKPSLLFLPFTMAMVWKDHTLIYISQAIVKRGTLSNYRICHQRFQSIRNYLGQVCPHSPSTLTSSIRLHKAFRMTLYFRLGDSLPTSAKNMTNPRIERVNTAIPESKSIHWLGIDISKNMIRNLSLTLGDTADSTVNMLAVQQRS